MNAVHTANMTIGLSNRAMVKKPHNVESSFPFPELFKQ